MYCYLYIILTQGYSTLFLRDTTLDLCVMKALQHFQVMVDLNRPSNFKGTNFAL